jgi:hypothetical protein
MTIESKRKHNIMHAKYEQNYGEPKSDQQSFSQPYRHFIEQLMDVAEKPPQKHSKNLEKLEP